MKVFTTEAGRGWLETEIFPAWMPQQRWFGGKAKEPRAFRIVRQVALDSAWLLGVEVAYAQGEPETYLVPLTLGTSADGVISRLEDGAALLDATHDEAFRAALFRWMADGVSRDGLRGEAGSFLKTTFAAGAVPASRVLKAEQSNSSLIYGEKLFVKLYRKLVAGMNPDAEMTRHLSEACHFEHVPAFGGAVEWDGCSVALATALVPNEGDAWQLALQHGELDAGRRGSTAGAKWSDLVHLLGLRTGELHRALARPSDDPAFAAEPFTPEDGQQLARENTRQAREVLELLRRPYLKLAGPVHVLVQGVVQREAELLRLAGSMAQPSGDVAIKIRTHGDYHLGQVIFTGRDFLILDFEGEPSRSLAERRAKRSPLRDLAGMCRSFDYAEQAAHQPSATEPWAVRGSSAASVSIFLAGWVRGFQPTSDGQFAERRAGEWLEEIRVFELEKLLYEVAYEINNRPDWLGIPLRRLAELMNFEPPPLHADP